MSLIKIILFLSSMAIFTGCSSNEGSNNLKSWLGEYEYEETPVQANAGYDMSMVWSLSLRKNVDAYDGILEVNGQQTYIKYLIKTSGDSGVIAIIFDKVVEGLDEGHKVGDTLFNLTRKDSRIITEWVSLKPRLLENTLMKCNCFTALKNSSR